MKRGVSFLIILFSVLSCCAQTQKGFVKTLGRVDQKGVALSGVSVRVKGEHNPVLSKADGTFSLSFPDKKNGDTYSLLQVQKSGYELNEIDIIGRQYALSDKVPLTIVMVSKAQLQADKQRIENKAFQTAEKNYKAKLAVLENQKKENTIAIEEYRQKLLEIQSNFEKYQSLIDGLAEHYAHVDYDVLDEKEREINICIENGELERAEALLNQLGIQQRIARIEQQLASGQHLMDEAQADMAAVLKKQEKDAEYLYLLYTIALARFDKENARQYIETRAALDTTNVEWQIEAGSFVFQMLADFGSASVYLNRALLHGISQFGKQSAIVAECYNNLGEIKVANEDYKAALELHEKCLAIKKNIPGISNHSMATSYSNMGGLYNRMGNYEEALKKHQYALELEMESDTPNLMDIALRYSNIGVDFFKLGNYEKALEYMTNALDIQNKVSNGIHPDVAVSYNNIASICNDMGNYAKALEYLEKALEINKTIYGSLHPSVAGSLNNIGYANYSLGNYKKALECFEEAQAAFIAIYGERHSIVASGFNNLGQLYSAIGQKEKAMEYLKRSLVIKKELLGEAHPAVALTYGNIGMEYYYLKDYQSALDYHQKALAIYQKCYDHDHADLEICYNNLGLAYSELGEYDKALEYYNLTVDMVKRLYGDKHAHLGRTFNNLGTMYMKMGELQKSEDYYTRCLDILKANYGEKHPQIAITYENIATTKFLLNDYRASLEFATKALALSKEIYGEEHPNTKRCVLLIEEIEKKLSGYGIISKTIQ